MKRPWHFVVCALVAAGLTAAVGASSLFLSRAAWGLWPDLLQRWRVGGFVFYLFAGLVSVAFMLAIPSWVAGPTFRMPQVRTRLDVVICGMALLATGYFYSDSFEALLRTSAGPGSLSLGFFSGALLAPMFEEW